MNLEKLIHDVNSKCSSLKDAAKLLPDSSTAERKELLGLMAAQARALAELLGTIERAK